MKNRVITVKKPPNSPTKNIQFDLFTEVLANDKESISNTVEFWERIPKYFFTKEQGKKLRTMDGLAKPYMYHYSYENHRCSVKIQPALIEQRDGNYIAHFPGTTEELVEEVLKKIFSDQQFGSHNPREKESWVRFSLKQIQRELGKKREIIQTDGSTKFVGRSRSIKEIKNAIEVMSSCIITLSIDDQEFWKGSILQDVITVERAEYVADPSLYYMARLPPFILNAINKLEYCQFN